MCRREVLARFGGHQGPPATDLGVRRLGDDRVGHGHGRGVAQEAIDLRAGQQVLDVATGSGNAAFAAARRWGQVTGIDYVPAFLEHGRALAAVARLPVTFCEGDAERIPFPEASFDVVLSTFGAQFAPDQEQTARELLRPLPAWREDWSG